VVAAACGLSWFMVEAGDETSSCLTAGEDPSVSFIVASSLLSLLLLLWLGESAASTKRMRGLLSPWSMRSPLLARGRASTVEVLLVVFPASGEGGAAASPVPTTPLALLLGGDVSLLLLLVAPSAAEEDGTALLLMMRLPRRMLEFVVP